MRSVGVEEELLLVNAETGIPRAVAARAIRNADTENGDEGGSLEGELQQQQLETDTPPTERMDVLGEDVRAWRRTAIDAAREAGARVIASGTSPLPVQPTVDTDPRYQQMIEHFGLTTSEQLTCACHVHVSVESPEEGVAVLDRIRTWTPLLIGLSANSPYWQGQDSGYASYRSQALQRWPSAGPQPVHGSLDGYEGLLQAMLDSGVILDRGMVYFDARLSHRFPTVEIRVADVCADARDTVLIAALCRALVDTAARQWQDGEPALTFSPTMVRLANWQASRHGLDADLLHPRTMRPVAARAALEELLDLLTPALDASGDLELVNAGVERILARGTGAARQRAMLEKTGQLSDVVAELARVTAGQDE
ncbi:carboxylate-amine ligase [Paramicrobacterium humi]|uniref:Putative glutamate--cysteine ligase 2 n=1 Tax=Paramicrobacterium humi TaxID=640635 RepID=A0A1H4Q0X8_9MICO|nr:glutamate--cysteine ligase [Microbacterium humi]SEC13305.1 carboxylate-amine ligase [Microbacterium humi]